MILLWTEEPAQIADNHHIEKNRDEIHLVTIRKIVIETGISRVEMNLANRSPPQEINTLIDLGHQSLEAHHLDTKKTHIMLIFVKKDPIMKNVPVHLLDLKDHMDTKIVTIIHIPAPNDHFINRSVTQFRKN